MVTRITGTEMLAGAANQPLGAGEVGTVAIEPHHEEAEELDPISTKPALILATFAE